jgi:NAD(P)-dependent dehydrogenase (short-subunit alcohol dehydrogenase family)
VILTGAAGSIGRYISRKLLREGAKVTMTGRDQTKLDGFVEELSEEGFDADNITTIVGDCADPECVVRLLRGPSAPLASSMSWSTTQAPRAQIYPAGYPLYRR